MSIPFSIPCIDHWSQDEKSIDAKAMKGILLSREDMDKQLRDLPLAMELLKEAADAGHHAAQVGAPANAWPTWLAV